MPDPEIVEGNEKTEVAAAPKKPLNIVLIAAIVGGIFLLIGSGVAAVLLVSSLAKAGRPASEAAASEPSAKEEKKASAHGGGEKKEGGEHGGAKKSAHGGGGGGSALMYEFEKPIIVNLAESNAERYLKVDITLELDSEKGKEDLQSRLPQVLDLLIAITSTKTMDDVSTVSGRNMLRQEMVDKINAILAAGQVKNVYFTEFVIQ